MLMACEVQSVRAVEIEDALAVMVACAVLSTNVAETVNTVIAVKVAYKVQNEEVVKIENA